MTTKNIEKEFRIEVIASLLENKLLSSEKYQVNIFDLFELCSFISGQDINNRNFYSLGNIVKNILFELQPELNIRINNTEDNLYEIDINKIISIYRKTYGDKYIIKSINKCLVKTLELQDK